MPVQGLSYHDAIATLQNSLGTERANEIIGEFKEIILKAINNIHIAYNKHDWELLDRSCHELKSNASMIGISNLSDTCIEIENFVIEGNHQGLLLVKEKLYAQCNETKKVIQKISIT